VKLTVPFPVPVDAVVSQAAELVAVQPHPAGPVTPNDPFPPLQSNEAADEENEYVHGGACVSVKV
jgi:hypothetical protein